MIFAVACEAVEESERPVARWTQRKIVDEVIKRGIVPYISKSHMNTLLIEAQLQPHKSRYWLNTKVKDPEVFQQQMQTVCEVISRLRNSWPSSTRTRSAQLNTHWSASLVLWVILMEGLKLSPEEVGVKGKSGILKNQGSRQAFLTAVERRIRFIYVPKP